MLKSGEKVEREKRGREREREREERQRKRGNVERLVRERN